MWEKVWGEVWGKGLGVWGELKRDEGRGKGKGVKKCVGGDVVCRG